MAAMANGRNSANSLSVLTARLPLPGPSPFGSRFPRRVPSIRMVGFGFGALAPGASPLGDGRTALLLPATLLARHRPAAGLTPARHARAYERPARKTRRPPVGDPVPRSARRTAVCRLDGTNSCPVWYRPR